jgi:hypothetical protein
MTIQNKSGEQRNISPQKWELMQNLGFAKDWTVISRDDVVVKKTLPKDLVNFRTLTKKNVKHGPKGKPVIPDNKAV